MKKVYNTPELEVEKFAINSNIITTSGEGFIPGEEPIDPGDDF